MGYFYLINLAEGMNLKFGHKEYGMVYNACLWTHCMEGRGRRIMV
jgi:hypothetical protein